MPMFKYECDEVKKIIDEVSPNYPQLTTFEKEWLYFHKYGYIPGIPVNLEYETVETSGKATVLDAIPYSYKSAILKGNTDENLQSVKMPVLKATGKNIFNTNKLSGGTITTFNDKKVYNYIDDATNFQYNDSFKNNTQYTLSLMFYRNTGEKFTTDIIFEYSDGTKTVEQFNPNTLVAFTSEKNKTLVRIKGEYNFGENVYFDLDTMQLEEGSTATSYEPLKANILTVNEDVILRSNGNVYDELDLLTGKLTQRIGEDGVVLSQEVVKTVKLTDKLSKPYEGVNHYETYSDTIPPIMFLEVPIVSTGDMTLLDIQNQD